ncbi:MAG TPA: flagellar biosynthesis protein FlgD [Rheinheimera sp.]|uniref:flagellar hook assembly protein FlgD n=1 Tax=unclassified Rheinheimera TaxID=115860 RepID=UPI000EC4F34F|nr:MULTISPECIES: flagellar hook assembly protein FlgD [unclassified Rheinheimera]MCT6700550.1 flagellar hook assembly protein FlgD [Rheinheimera sp. 4Y26]HCU66586.1 flagellar biosynthesis protein FlgD [Rheinheimera sp.]
MTTVSNNTSNSYLDSLKGANGAKEKTDAEKAGALTQADFFALLTQQLAFQDPTKPVENDQMIAQMTNFTMADGISSLNSNFKDFASSMDSNQALQASSLVGRTVRVSSDQMPFDGTNMAVGSTEVPANTSLLTVKIYNAAGALVRSEPAESPPSGKFDFAWDGNNDAGEALPKGMYTVKVEATVNGKTEALPTSSYVPVTSVTLGKGTGDMTLNLFGLGAKKLTDILEIAAG